MKKKEVMKDFMKKDEKADKKLMKKEMKKAEKADKGKKK